MRFLRADKLFDGKNFLSDGSVLVLDGADRLIEVTSGEAVDQDRIEDLQGILTPGFVNAHCHLELSHLKGLIPRQTGLPEFARQIIVSRNQMRPEERAEHMQAADREMWNNGIVAVGDISNGSESFDQKVNSKIFYHTFIELIGLDPKNAKTAFENGLALLQMLRTGTLQGSLAPHAPYSTSKDLIQKIATYDQLSKAAFSIHNQESEEETKFFMGKKNGIDGLYRFLGLDISWFRAPGSSSLRAYSAVLPDDTPSLLVHNTFTTLTDLEATHEKAVYWCFCPGANQYIEGRLPDFEVFKGLDHRLCIGTDSLASNGQLHTVAEADLILKSGQSFPLESLLRALTLNGAEALGISHAFGQLHVGKNAGLNLIAFRNLELALLKKIS